MNSRMSCAEMEPLLSELVDNSLDRTAAETVHAHLAECPACRRLLADLQHLRTDLGRLPLVAPPDSLVSRIRNRARAEGLLRHTPPGASWRELLPALAAAALLAVVIGIWPLLLRPPADPLSPPVSEVEQSLVKARQAYQAAFATLEPQAQRQARQLPPDARQSYETNLALLDGVIANVEQVLRRRQEDPRSWERLLEIYQQKVDFLDLILGVDAG
jgi:anti-sigma factor RsiW